MIDLRFLPHDVGWFQLRAQLEPQKGNPRKHHCGTVCVLGCDKCAAARGGMTTRPGAACPCQLTHCSKRNVIIIDICISVIANDCMGIASGPSLITPSNLKSHYSSISFATASAKSFTHVPLARIIDHRHVVIATLPNLSMIALTLAKFC